MFVKSIIASVAIAWAGLTGSSSPETVAPTPEDTMCVYAPEVVAEQGGVCGLPGDDNGDGFIDEDESGWDCATMGNRICGPVALEG